jgi:hypothetical protein
MMMFGFATLIVAAVIAIFGGILAVAIRRSQQERVTTEETGVTPDTSMSPDHLRMW